MIKKFINLIKEWYENKFILGTFNLPISISEEKYKYIDTSDIIPEYGTKYSAGMDLKSSIDIVIEPGEQVLVPSGIRMAIPKGYEGQIRSKSGMTVKFRTVVGNGVGTIDADYRGDVKVILKNDSNEKYIIKAGDKIAQIVFAKVNKAKIIIVDDLNNTVRSTGGFGSTGIRKKH